MTCTGLCLAYIHCIDLASYLSRNLGRVRRGGGVVMQACLSTHASGVLTNRRAREVLPGLLIDTINLWPGDGSGPES
jgi:hypothetical protein